MSSLLIPDKLVPDSPALLDRAVLEISTNLATELSWLDNTFGLCQRVQLPDQGSIPAYYHSNGIDYFPLFPDESLGNFLFWDRDETRDIFDRPETFRGTNIKSKVGLIVWYKIDTVYPANWQTRTRENVKDQVLSALDTISHRHSKYLVMDIFHEGKNIYKGYNLPEDRQQYLLRPFGGFRINLDITYDNETYC